MNAQASENLPRKQRNPLRVTTKSIPISSKWLMNLDYGTRVMKLRPIPGEHRLSDLNLPSSRGKSGMYGIFTPILGSYQ
jgi:hypothetical protein